LIGGTLVISEKVIVNVSPSEKSSPLPSGSVASKKTIDGGVVTE